MKFCIDCGEPSEQTRCDEHRKERRNQKNRGRSSASQRGYGSRWTRLSRKARKLQPFCLDCGATDDLQADHTPEAWRRYDEGKPIRLQDIDVVCGECNRARGQARPGGGGLLRSAQDAAPVGHEANTDANYSQEEGVRAGEGRTQGEG